MLLTTASRVVTALKSIKLLSLPLTSNYHAFTCICIPNVITTLYLRKLKNIHYMPISAPRSISSSQSAFRLNEVETLYAFRNHFVQIRHYLIPKSNSCRYSPKRRLFLYHFLKCNLCIATIYLYIGPYYFGSLSIPTLSNIKMPARPERKPVTVIPVFWV